jgi:F-type H+-transporting ATPase subunit b
MRKLLLLCAAVFTIAVLGASPALAADDHGGGAAKAGPLDIAFDTAIWAALVFFLMLIVLRARAWNPILEGLQKREESIRSSLQEAKTTRDEMVTMRAAFQKDLAEAHQQIPLLMEEARRKAEEMANDMRAKAAADIQTERERLRREVEIAKDQAIKQLWEQAAQLATLISAKAIGRALSEDDHRRLLDESLQEMRQAERN